MWEVVRQVPRGRVTTYGAIGKYLGTASSARMVGWAMNASHGAHPAVPAHRVVNRCGLLTGRHHFPHPELMEELLKAEDVAVEDNKVLDFEQILWLPDHHLVPWVLPLD